ncbi:MAG: hypothetical protein FJZ16_03675 [Candidatus Omnitrophica bacterium]|nr:hypothetical protein [Candidatus Omnitrophota bacterium]
MRAIRKTKKTNDHEWIRKNIENLVKKYGGKFLVIAENEPFIGDDAKELVKKAKTKHPNAILTSMPIPRPEDFTCAL